YGVRQYSTVIFSQYLEVIFVLDDNHDELFTINDFAKACKTTKDTLYHYEKNDILRPTIDAKNHYRYYTTLDFHKFQFIAHLRNFGFTISEIREYQNHRTVSGYIDLLQTVQEKTTKEIEQLNKRLVICNYTRESMIEFQNCVIDTPTIFSLGESYYFMSPFNGSLNSLQGIQEMSDHLERLLHNPRKTVPVVAIKVNLNEKNSSGAPTVTFTSKTSTPELFEKERIYHRPAGQYMHMYIKADLLSTDHTPIINGLKKMEDYAEKHNYHFTTDLFCINRVNRFVTTDPDEYLVELVIGVD
ncbi:MAG: MerR family transcriptional regulator, partial [Lachnospiraceae bacterium]|nr:MerR family transcriptional regulator [Lachnospiraceae bacterium]